MEGFMSNKLDTIFNGFWFPGETGWTGSSFLNSYRKVQSVSYIRFPYTENKWLKRIFPFLGRDYGLCRHVKCGNFVYNSEKIKKLQEYGFLIMVSDLYMDEPTKCTKKYILQLDQTISDLCEMYDIETPFVTVTTEGDYYLGTPDDAYFYMKKGLTQLQPSGDDSNVVAIGFSEKEQKWYGWSHRAMCGFTIGSEVKKGDCAYSPKNLDELLEYYTNFWSSNGLINVKSKVIQDPKTKEYLIQTNWDFVDGVDVSDKVSSVSSEIPDKYGKGEWVARTMEDAKQMAIDFAKSVS